MLCRYFGQIGYCLSILCKFGIVIGVWILSMVMTFFFLSLLLFFSENKAWHFMQTVSTGDSLHEISSLIFLVGRCWVVGWWRGWVGQGRKLICYIWIWPCFKIILKMKTTIIQSALFGKVLQELHDYILEHHGHIWEHYDHIWEHHDHIWEHCHSIWELGNPVCASIVSVRAL